MLARNARETQRTETRASVKNNICFGLHFSENALKTAFYVWMKIRHQPFKVIDHHDNDRDASKPVQRRHIPKKRFGWIAALVGSHNWQRSSEFLHRLQIGTEMQLGCYLESRNAARRIVKLIENKINRFK